MMPEYSGTSQLEVLRKEVINTLNQIVPKALTDVLDKTLLEYKNRLKQEMSPNHEQQQSLPCLEEEKEPMQGSLIVLLRGIKT